MTSPIALTCGEPAGIGPELAVSAWKDLRDELPFFLIGDPAHLPDGASIVEIASPAEAIGAMSRGLPLLRHDFAQAAVPGQRGPLRLPVPDMNIFEALWTLPPP